ncbi:MULTISPECIES: hypothetical protein [unclassified Fusibacter]|uniref:hypothetical protein n=1 Tax=unclassified Fusibacter TaxID=2624464 RepID=UPI00101388D7|nr:MULTISPECIES: hypothetical protein [unclassified Fusibacter]MCK8059626.1 hypothetical protein [Fusibacter sp. A2]NPE21427.1 hypothetical protein [Fusibacter sp. A1]RXV61839.1 hypothetical protein DWB64_06275 [Fusibacter sp. A1]
MKHHQQSLIEYLPEFTWIHFKNHEIVDMETLEEIISDNRVMNDESHPILLDISQIDGFYVDAFEMLIAVLSGWHNQVALLSHIDSISEKYASLLEMSLENNHTKSFKTLVEAKSWMIH